MIVDEITDMDKIIASPFGEGLLAELQVLFVAKREVCIPYDANDCIRFGLSASQRNFAAVEVSPNDVL
jgi:hypothetical protein